MEAAVDHILVEEGEPINSLDDLSAQSRVKVFPNPFGQTATLAYEINEPFGSAVLRVYNSFGQQLQQREVAGQKGQVQLGQDLPNGIYWVKLEADGQPVETVKMVKAN